MDNKEFEKYCIRIVREYANGRADLTGHRLVTDDDVYVVWLCKALGNNKALLSTILYDGMYYEVTYNGEASEFYLDAYKKFENRCIRLYPDPM